MNDPMDTPPTDYGSDRYDYIEIIAPAGIRPDGEWFERLCTDPPCQDCRANIFVRWTGGPTDHALSWDVKIAHDETCPFMIGK